MNDLHKKLIEHKNLIGCLSDVAIQKGYPIFKCNKNYPINLNIWGIRSKDIDINYYNDVIIIFYNDSINSWYIDIYDATTKPGSYYLQNPLNEKGCAILKEGFYRGLWKIGLHKGYTALIQANPCTVYRDNNKDNIIDKDIPTETGMFSIDLHRASAWKVEDEVGLYSAGCQVIKDVNEFNIHILPLVKKAIGNGTTSYALINETDLNYEL